MAYSALRRSVSSSWLVKIITTESALTGVPGRIRMLFTLPSVVAGISIVSSGTSVPRPRTSRVIGPRFTVSRHTTDKSTDGAAGFKPAHPNGSSADCRIRTIPTMIRRIIRFLPASLRCISIWVPVPLRHGACQSSFSVTLDVSGCRTDRREFGVFACGTDVPKVGRAPRR